MLLYRLAYVILNFNINNIFRLFYKSLFQFLKTIFIGNLFTIKIKIIYDFNKNIYLVFNLMINPIKYTIIYIYIIKNKTLLCNI